VWLCAGVAAAAAAAVDQEELEATGEALRDGEPAERGRERAVEDDHGRPAADTSVGDPGAVGRCHMVE
jgi:hypothetical protein